MKSQLIVFLLFIGASSHLIAQQQEEAAIKKVISDMFLFMQKADTASLKRCFMPEARLQTALLNKKTGRTKLVTEPIDSFISLVAKISAKDSFHFEERILSYEIRTDDPMATVWTPYECYINHKFSHGGVDAFQLFRSVEGWKIIQICDTRRK